MALSCLSLHRYWREKPFMPEKQKIPDNRDFEKALL
jgi:hypothetical protein